MRRSGRRSALSSTHRGRDRSRGSARPFALCLAAAVAGALTCATLAGCDRSDAPPELTSWPVVATPQFPLGMQTDFAWLATAQRDEVMLLGKPDAVHVAGRVTAICPVPALDYGPATDAPVRFGFMIFHECGVRYAGSYLREGADEAEGCSLAIDGQLPPVRAATPVWPDEGDTGELVALITGGEMPTPRPADVQAEPPPWVTGTEVQLAWLQGEALVVGSPEALAGTDPWAMRAGKFAGQEDNLLVCVYTQAPFDEVTRRRPWIYRVVVGDDGLPHLDPRWRGTSFARPFRDATFGDFTGTGEGEIAALEVTEDGGRALTAYLFEGFGLEGMAESVELPAVEDRLEAARWVGGNADELVVRTTDGRFLFFGLATDAGELRQVLEIDGPGGILGWTITSASGGEPGELLCVLANGEVWRTDSVQTRG